MQKKADPNVQTKEGVPLTVAIDAGHTATILHLLEAGANPNAYVDQNYSKVITPLNEAIRKGELDIVKLLLQFGANPNMGYSCLAETTSPLLTAVRNKIGIRMRDNDKPIVASLLRHGAYPYEVNGINVLSVMKQEYFDKYSIPEEKNRIAYKKIARVFVQYAGVKRALSGEFIDQQKRLPAEIIAMIMPFVGINLASELEANT
ncbi:MAG: ankyrin repeat domain-containing protein [Candidatus Babeliales bacterium]